MGPASAQPVLIPEHSLGAESSRVVVDAFGSPGFDVIRGGALRGHNLCHRFDTFGVERDRMAVFSKRSPQVENIFTRVTGNYAS